MRYANFNIDIFKLVKREGLERYLYLTQKELLEKKSEIDNKIIEYRKYIPYKHSNSEEITLDIFPPTSFLYSRSLIVCAVISLILDYKIHNWENDENRNLMQTKEFDDFACNMIINKVREDPEISYLELVALGNEDDEMEFYLERLIENKTLHWHTEKTKDGDKCYWEVREKRISKR